MTTRLTKCCRALVAFMTCVLMLGATFSAYAAEEVTTETSTSATAADAERSTKLLSDFSITATRVLLPNGNYQLRVTAKTIGTGTMDKIGLKNCKVEYLENGVWKTDFTITDQLASNASSHTYTKDFAIVQHRTYRFSATHYAEKTTLLVFKDTQSQPNASGSVTIP